MTAKVCFSCENELVEEAEFCSACGVGVADVGLLLDPLGGGNQGRRRRPSAPESGTAVRAGSGRLAIALAVSLVLGSVAWLALGSSREDTEEAAQPDQGLASTTQPDNGVLPADEAGSGGEVTTDAASEEAAVAQAGTPSADWPPTSIETVAGSGQAVLGEITGQYLMINRSSDVLRLDLDSGAIEIYQTLARPIAAFESEILMWSRQGLIAAPADDATAKPRVVYDRPVDASLRTYLEALSVLDGDRLVFEFALFASGQVGPVKVLVDVSSGESSNLNVPPRSSSIGGLVSVPGGGTFDFVEGEFQPVFQGEAVAVGRRSVVGYQCLDPKDCRLVLVDRMSGEIRDTALPDIPVLTDIFFVDPQDRFLLVVFDRPRLWDLERQAYVAEGFLDGLAADGPPRETPTQVAVSPNGRWVASGQFNTVRFLDLETGDEHTVEMPPSPIRLENISQVLFVDNNDSGVAGS